MSVHRLLAFAFITLATLAHADPGVLHITTDPGDAQIFINGQRKGNSPPSQEEKTFAIKLSEGSYLVEARKSDGKNYYGKKDVFLANDSLQTVNIPLAEVTAPYGQAPNGSANVAGREWLRCSLGQKWSGSACMGQANAYSFEEARAAADTFNVTGYGGKRDWRVPTMRELASLRVCSTGFASDTRDTRDGGNAMSKSCNANSGKPTIDTSMFPETPSAWFWSSSPSIAAYDEGAWVVGFNDGSIGHYGYLYHYGHVRLVR